MVPLYAAGIEDLGPGDFLKPCRANREKYFRLYPLQVEIIVSGIISPRSSWHAHQCPSVYIDGILVER